MNKLMFFLLCFVMIACDKDNVDDTYTYEYMENSELTISTLQNSYMKYATVSEGDKAVFKYHFIAADEEEIADDEYSEYIYFEIDSDLENFLIEDESLSLANTVLTKVCFCGFLYESEKDVSPSGSISGEKISDNTWKVVFDVTFYGDDHRTFEANFILK